MTASRGRHIRKWWSRLNFCGFARLSYTKTKVNVSWPNYVLVSLDSKERKMFWKWVKFYSVLLSQGSSSRIKLKSTQFFAKLLIKKYLCLSLNRKMLTLKFKLIGLVLKCGIMIKWILTNIFYYFLQMVLLLSNVYFLFHWRKEH